VKAKKTSEKEIGTFFKVSFRNIGCGAVRTNEYYLDYERAFYFS
jgi:hypothetical protein